MTREALIGAYHAARKVYLEAVESGIKSGRLVKGYKTIKEPKNLSRLSSKRLSGAIKRIFNATESIKPPEYGDLLLERFEALINNAIYDPEPGLRKYYMIQQQLMPKIYASMERIVKSHGRIAKSDYRFAGGNTKTGKEIFKHNLKKNFNDLYDDMVRYLYGSHSMRLGLEGDIELLKEIIRTLSNVEDFTYKDNDIDIEQKLMELDEYDFEEGFALPEEIYDGY